VFFYPLFLVFFSPYFSLFYYFSIGVGTQVLTLMLTPCLLKPYVNLPDFYDERKMPFFMGDPTSLQYDMLRS